MWARAFAILLLLATLAVSVPLVAGLLARLHPAFDSFGHFRWHLSLALIAVALVLAATRFRREGIVGLLLGLGALWTTLPGMGLAAVATADAEGRPSYRLLQLNLFFDNPSVADVLSLVGREKPDVITFDEVSDAWRPRLELLAPMYPYRAVCTSSRRVGGVAILSRRPLAPGHDIECLSDGMLAIARVDFGGRWVDVAAVHLHWPWPFYQPDQIAGFSPRLRELGRSAILAGDLNAATWSAAARTIATASGATVVQGIGPTWLPLELPAALIDYIGLPIDNVFAKGDVHVVSATRLERVGSDHLPILVRFSLPPGPGEDQTDMAMAQPVDEGPRHE